MEKVEIIKALIDSGRARDILDFVEGESKYISDDSEERPQSKDFRKIWVLVVHYLRFVSEYGKISGATRDGKYLVPYPQEFRLWLDAGAPVFPTKILEGN